jgi:hypothetical protein
MLVIVMVPGGKTATESSCKIAGESKSRCQSLLRTEGVERIKGVAVTAFHPQNRIARLRRSIDRIVR